MWRKLQEAILAIYDERPISYTLEELYQAVENMCSYKMAPTLYGRLGGICQEHVATLVPIFQKYPYCLLVLVVCVRVCVCVRERESMWARAPSHKCVAMLWPRLDNVVRNFSSCMWCSGCGRPTVSRWSAHTHTHTHHTHTTTHTPHTPHTNSVHICSAT